MEPRNWDVNGWAVDCRPGPVRFERRHCAHIGCTFAATASDETGARLADLEHFRAVHLPNENYSAHTQQHS